MERKTAALIADKIDSLDMTPPPNFARSTHALPSGPRSALLLLSLCYHVRHCTSMEKDFDRWNRHKKHINDAGDRPFYHAREIWWCAVGVNVGNELDGTGKEHDRPVLVIRPF